MRQFLINIALFSSILIVIYLLLFNRVENTLKTSNYVDYQNWNDIYSGDINADLVILGSSRARKMVSPKIIDQKLNLKSYNLGMEGYKLPFQLIKYKIYKKHNISPKIVIQIVDHFTLSKRQDLFNIDQFLPYLNDSIMEKATAQYEGFSWGGRHLPYWRYFGKSNTILAGISELVGIKSFTSAGYKGYYPKATHKWEKDFENKKIANPDGERTIIDKDAYQTFKQHLFELEKDSIIQFIVYAPEFHEFHNYLKNRDSISNLYHKLTDQIKNCIYIDYRDSLISKNEDYFYNPTHLNKTGSEKFTDNLSAFIHSTIKD